MKTATIAGGETAQSADKRPIAPFLSFFRINQQIDKG